VALRDWAASGEYDLIIAHGSQYGSIIEELAPEFPETSFAWGTDENTFGLDNVFAYTVAADQGGYVNGVVAAGFTRSKVIGVVGPIEVGDAKLYVDGFVKGATDAGLDAQVLVTYIGSFSDVTLATEAAKTHIANGADVLTGTAQMVVGPIAVAQEEGAFWLGTQSSQAELAANAGLTFQIYHWEIVLAEIITKIEEGTLGGESFVLTLENGGLEIQLSEFNEAFTEETVTALQTNLEPLIEGIIAGDVVTKPEEEATPEPEATEEG
jgi:basic membrane lipoprotein Med (substrate-binding protein (PBP1-ABC) superfamily)